MKFILVKTINPAKGGTITPVILSETQYKKTYVGDVVDIADSVVTPFIATYGNYFKSVESPEGKAALKSKEGKPAQANKMAKSTVTKQDTIHLFED